MRLYELAYCCHIYSLEVFDEATVELRSATGSAVDPGNPHHVGPLFTWLRKWGCRQFTVRDEEIAHQHLTDWWRIWHEALPSPEQALDELDDAGLDSVANAYEDLRLKQASWQVVGDESFPKTFGPAGAAKTLYAIRPQTCSPWDEPIRKWFHLSVKADGYRTHLMRIREELAEAVADLGPEYTSRQLPVLLERPESSPVKLVDEHDWVRYTRGFKVPSPDLLDRWATWARVPASRR